MVSELGLWYAKENMKHLHYTFIIASIALGFGCSFLFGAIWNVHAIPMSGLASMRTYLSAMLSTVIGIILLTFGWTGIRSELNDQK